MDETKLKLALEVGKASEQAIVNASRMVKPGARLLDVAEAAEKALMDLGFNPAFPINLSINEQAAHYTPSFDDTAAFTDNDIVKIDFGAEKSGMLGDGALTVDLSGKHGKMIEAAELALDNAISLVKAGAPVHKIGAEISATIEKMGFQAIINLGGHGIEENNLHTGNFIPNYDNGDEYELEEGTIIAIEPFLTTSAGAGHVVEGDSTEIFTYLGGGQARLPSARSILKEIEANYSANPFAARWLSNSVNSKFSLYSGIQELYRNGCLEANPVLVEAGKAPVAQAEAELLVEKGGCKVITRAKL